jgi:hypothetical protein
MYVSPHSRRRRAYAERRRGEWLILSVKRGLLDP